MQPLVFAKKVLVVSNHAPPATGGSPHVFYNLFSQFDPRTYAIYTHEKNLRSGDWTRQLPCIYYTYAPANNILGAPKALLLAVREGLRIIKKERIELIIGMPDKGTALVLTLMLSVLARRPYVLYMLDPYRGTDASRLRRWLAVLLEPLFFHFARLVIAVGKGHLELYQRLYGVRFRFAVLFHATPRATFRPASPPENPPRTILYSGSIYAAQESSIRNLIKAVESMPDLPLSVELYVNKDVESIRARFAGHACVSVAHAKREDMPAIQHSADILFLPLAWEASEELLAIAIPAKLPEYLQAGRPILVHAPPTAGLCRYAREEGFALVVDEENIGKLSNAVRKLLEDRGCVESLATNARRTFEENHEARACATKFACLINKVSV